MTVGETAILNLLTLLPVMWLYPLLKHTCLEISIFILSSNTFIFQRLRHLVKCCKRNVKINASTQKLVYLLLLMTGEK